MPKKFRDQHSILFYLSILYFNNALYAKGTEEIG